MDNAIKLDTDEVPRRLVRCNQDQVVFNNIHTGRPTSYTVSVATGEAFDLASITLEASHDHHAAPTLSISGSLLSGDLAYSGHHPTAITLNVSVLLDIGSEISDRNFTQQAITIDADNGGAARSGGQLESGSTTVNNLAVTCRFLNQGPTSFNTR